MQNLENILVFLAAHQDERRKAPRYRVFTPCNIHDVSMDTFTMCNVSLTGCQLVVSEHWLADKFEPGKQYVLHVFPTTMDNKDTHFAQFQVTTNLVWKDKRNKDLNLGFRIVDTEAGAFQKWLSFIAGHSSTKKAIKRLI